MNEVFFERIYWSALHTAAAGNVPVAALVVDGGTIVAEGVNRSRVPRLSPGRHAELEALRAVPEQLWTRSRSLTLYTSLEPCLMCFGAIVMHRFGRVVFAASDPLGGVLGIIPSLPDHVRDKAAAIEWIGPADPVRFAGLTARALELRSDDLRA